MKHLKIVEEKLQARLAEGNDDAFYILDTSDVRAKYRAWVENIPRVKPFYAVKCNENEAIVKTLRDAGAGFDCASKREIEQILDLGVSPEDIIYSHTAKQVSYLKFAALKNVKKLTFDCEEELKKIKEFHPNAEVILRIKFDSKKTVVVMGLKSGCDTALEAPNLIEMCRNLNLNLIGVSFHVGSGSEDYEIFAEAIKAVREVFDVAKTFGFDMNFVDIGGGFIGDKDDSILDYSTHINSAIEKYFSDPSIKIISEPGRYFVESAMTRAIQIVLKRTTPDGLMNYYINDGIYMSFLINFIYNGEYLKLGSELQIIRKNPELKKKYNNLRSMIWGTSCNSKDLVFDNILIPELEVGDWIVFKNMGAYTTAVSANFNGFKIAKEDIIII